MIELRGWMVAAVMAAIVWTPTPSLAQVPAPVAMCNETFLVTLTGVDAPGTLALTGNDLARPLNQQHCDQAADVNLIINYMNTPSPQFLDLWVGQANTNCNEETRRSGNMSQLCSDVMPDIQNPGASRENVEVPLSALLTDPMNPCETGGDQWLFFLAAPAASTTA